MEFQQIVLMAAVVVLIITLAMVGNTLRKQRKNAVYPPVVAACPDYWTNTADGECERGELYNRGDITACPAETVDFSSMNDCDKYEWATGCQVTWDGVSHNPSICDTS